MVAARRQALELAFLGCGNAARMHSRTLSGLDADVHLHYASRDPAKAKAFRDAHRGAGAFGSYEAAIGDPRIDVVVVVTPPALHLELTLQALDAGKDVIVEKPAFTRPEDFERVRELCMGSGRRVFVAENYFYKPLREWLCRIIVEGLVGEPLFLHVNALKRQAASGWRKDPALAGGGALFEGGVHWINFMANLGLDVKRAVGYRAGAGRDAAASDLVVLQYAGGAVGTLSYSWEVSSLLRGLRLSKLFGRDGSATFESNGLFLLLRGSRTRLYIPAPREIGGYRAMFRDYLDAIRTGREPRMTLEMAERDVRLIAEVSESLGGSPAGRAGKEGPEG